MNDAKTPPNQSLRDRKKDDARTRIVDALIGLMAEGRLDISHDLVADRAGIGRRTVYRYFPDRDALLQGALERIRAFAGLKAAYPSSLDALIASLPDIYAGFDNIAEVATLVRSTPQGRAIRQSQQDARAKAYRQALEPVVAKLPAADRRAVIALLQMLHTTPWLEMRDTWDLPGSEMARVIAWALRTLERDLKDRGDTPISAGA